MRHRLLATALAAGCLGPPAPAAAYYIMRPKDPAQLPARPAASPAVNTHLQAARKVWNDGDVAHIRAQREALYDPRGIDVRQLSRDIAASVAAAQSLLLQQQPQAALARMQALQKYMPLAELPSYDVHRACQAIYQALGQPQPAQRHLALQQAAAQVLVRDIGTGNTPDDPLRIVQPHELMEWIEARSGVFQRVQLATYQGNTLMQAQYRVGPNSGKLQQVYAALDPRAGD